MAGGARGVAGRTIAVDDPRRIQFLDGLRGIAILGVMLWHYTDEVYSDLLPYGTTYSAIPVIDHGWIGVNLFFLISGFVILMTLERSEHMCRFLKQRWLRLFPAMLIASAIIFIVSQFNGGRMPHGTADIQDVLPGLTFVSVGFYNEFVPLPINELDGVFWTLYVEAGFYVVFGALFFAFGWQRALTGLAAIWLTTLAAIYGVMEDGQSWVEKPFLYLQWVGAAYFGWFVSGALFYKAMVLSSQRLFAGAILVGLLSAFTSDLWQPSDLVSQIHLCGCVGLFASAQRAGWLQNMLATPWLLFFGFISYPLYLLHNELGIGLISAFGTLVARDEAYLAPIVVAGIVTVLSYGVAKYGEPALKSVLARLIRL